MKKRAVTYARVSSDDRGKDGLNLFGQLELCRSYARKKGYDIVAELSEDQRGVSGALLNTPALSQALAMAKNKAFDVLIIREVDRFARSLAKQLIVEQEFKKLGVGLEYVIEEYSTSPEGNLHKNIKAVIAEYERVKISERTVRGRRQLVKTGNVLVHGRPPYGYRLQRQNGKSRLTIYEPEARIVQIIFGLYVNGDDDHPPLSSREIAEKLCEMGFPGPENGKPKLDEWSQNTIQHILRSETYVGVWYYGKYTSYDGHRLPHPEHKWMPVAIPSIISRDIWKLAENKRLRNRSYSPRNIRNEYLIGTCAYCKVCKGKMSSRSGGNGRTPRIYYYCPTAHKRNTKNQCSNKKYFRADHTDNTVWQWLKSYLSDQDLTESGLNHFSETHENVISTIKEKMQVVENLLEQHRGQLQKLTNLYLEGLFPRARLMESKNKLESKISKLVNELAQLTEQLQFWSSSFSQAESIKVLVKEISDRLEAADHDFDHRRKIIEFIDFRAGFFTKNGKPFLKIDSLIFNDVELNIQSTILGINND